MSMDLIMDNWRNYIVEDFCEKNQIVLNSYNAPYPGILNEELLREGFDSGTIKSLIQYVVSAAAEYGIGGAAGVITIPAAGAGLATGPVVETVVDSLFAAEAVASTISAVENFTSKLGEFQQLFVSARSTFKGMAGNLSGFYQNLTQLVRSALAVLGKKAAGGVDAAAIKLRDIINKLLKAMVRSVKSGIKLVIPDATIGTFIAEALGQILSAVSKNAFTLAQKAIDKVSILKKWIAQPATAIAFFKDIFQQIVQLMGAATEKVKEMGWAKVMLLFGPVGGALIKKFGPSGIAKVSQLFEKYIPNLLKVINGVLTVVVPVFLTSLALFQILVSGDYKGDGGEVADTKTAPPAAGETAAPAPTAPAAAAAVQEHRSPTKMSMKPIMENWRRFQLNELTPSQGSIPTKVGLSPQQQKQQKKVLKDLIGQEYTTFVDELQNLVKDGKFRQFLNMGIEDGDMQDDVISVNTAPIPVKDLRPTQSQIGLADSLGWVSQNKPQQAGTTAAGGVADVGGPIITANGKFIVDGHHRWSQVYLLNPDASIPAVDFQISGSPDAKKVLKLTQLAIAAVDRVLPLVSADAKTDIYATEGNEDAIRNILNSVVSDEMAQSLMGPYQAPNKEGVIDRITQNALALYEKGTHNPDVPRSYMPQLDKISPPDKKVQRLGVGDVNWNPKA